MALRQTAWHSRAGHQADRGESSAIHLQRRWQGRGESALLFTSESTVDHLTALECKEQQQHHDGRATGIAG
jgi:hypothetical protein